MNFPFFLVRRQSQCFKNYITLKCQYTFCSEQLINSTVEKSHVSLYMKLNWKIEKMKISLVNERWAIYLSMHMYLIWDVRPDRHSLPNTFFRKWPLSDFMRSAKFHILICSNLGVTAGNMSLLPFMKPWPISCVYTLVWKDYSWVDRVTMSRSGSTRKIRKNGIMSAILWKLKRGT